MKGLLSRAANWVAGLSPTGVSAAVVAIVNFLNLAGITHWDTDTVAALNVAIAAVLAVLVHRTHQAALDRQALKGIALGRDLAKPPPTVTG